MEAVERVVPGEHSASDGDMHSSSEQAGGVPAHAAGVW